ncbi:MAG: hypothetical protein HY823_10200 [Acidobacteria bacterium]|nr:hypothetical protein [Acidobacteriota bacterium]
MGARYLNTDLIIRSKTEFKPIIDFLNEKVLFLWNDIIDDKFTIGIESNLLQKNGPEDDINYLLLIFESMPNNLHEIWNKIDEKIIDIGFECEHIKFTMDQEITSKLIQKLGAMGFSMNIRIYPLSSINETVPFSD